MMMISSLAFTFSLAFIANNFAMAQTTCKAKQIASGCKANIKKPFKYDSYAVNEFTFDAKPHEIEVQFTAFQGQKYKIVFYTELRSIIAHYIILVVRHMMINQSMQYHTFTIFLQILLL